MWKLFKAGILKILIMFCFVLFFLKSFALGYLEGLNVFFPLLNFLFFRKHFL